MTQDKAAKMQSGALQKTAESQTGTVQKPAKKQKFWTPANIVTLVRICCVPVFVVAIISPWPAWFGDWSGAEAAKPWVAAGVFILLAATDGLDGYLARTRNEVTDFGKFMDPLADKILVAAALLALVELSVLPSWPALIILTREFIVSGIRMVAASKGRVIAASWYGKAKTVTQIIAIVLFIIKDSVVQINPEAALESPLYWFSWAVMILALVLTVVSMFDYFAGARDLLGFRDKDGSADASEGEGVGEVGGAVKSESYGEPAGNQEKIPDIMALLESPDALLEPGENERLARCVIKAALENKIHLSTAESLTGGLIAATLTSIPGSSDVVLGGVASYTNEVKHHVLGVDEHVLATEGAVCEKVASQMAQGSARLLSADIAVSVTGVAGPGGGTYKNPVGTVWFGFFHNNQTRACMQYFTGSREEVRQKTTRYALGMILCDLGICAK